MHQGPEEAQEMRNRCRRDGKRKCGEKNGSFGILGNRTRDKDSIPQRAKTALANKRIPIGRVAEVRQFFFRRGNPEGINGQRLRGKKNGNACECEWQSVSREEEEETLESYLEKKRPNPLKGVNKKTQPRGIYSLNTEM